MNNSNYVPSCQLRAWPTARETRPLPVHRGCVATRHERKTQKSNNMKPPRRMFWKKVLYGLCRHKSLPEVQAGKERERETTKKKDNTRKATVQVLLVLLVFSSGTMSLISHQLTQQEVLTKGTMERERDRESIPVRLVSRVLADSCWLNWISPLGCARATPVISCCWQALAIR